ncbi:MAG: hypothetical protein FJ224_07955 [Lentisphaerae bacterium]|nr:hypothetical protein [Lentisphaerota bacterium]
MNESTFRKRKLLSDLVSFRKHVAEPASSGPAPEEEGTGRASAGDRAFIRLPAPAIVCSVLRGRHGEALDFIVAAVNDAFAEFSGRSSAGCRGRRLVDVFGDESCPMLDACAASASGVKTAEFPVQVSGRRMLVGVSGCAENELVLLFRDVTHQAETHEALESDNRQFRDFMARGDVMVCRCAPDGTVTFANEAYRRLCHSGDGLARMPFGLDHVPDEDRAAARSAHESLSADSEYGTYSCRFRTGAGEERWLEWREQVLLDSRRLIVGYQLAGFDVTAGKERAAAEIAVARAESDGRAQEPAQPVGGFTGTLTVCGECKRTMDGDGNWLPFDRYIETHTDARVDMSICPYCRKRSYPALYQR